MRLDSDWIRPVTVTLTNATVSSSEVIGSACHVAKIIDEHMVQLTLPLKCELEGCGVSGLDTGSTVVDPGNSALETGSGSLEREGGVHPGSNDLETGSGALEKESVFDPECSDTETGSSDGGTGSRGHDPVCRLCDPGKEVYVSGIDVCETGGSVSEPKCDVSDAGCKIRDPQSNAPGSRVRCPRRCAHGQVRDIGRCIDMNESNIL